MNMKKCAEEVKQKKLAKNTGYSIMVTSNKAPMTTSYMHKPLNEYTTIQRTTYAPPPPLNLATGSKVELKETKETKSFMDDEDEEVSVAFEELMTEIAKYEGDKKPPTPVDI